MAVLQVLTTLLCPSRIRQYRLISPLLLTLLLTIAAASVLRLAVVKWSQPPLGYSSANWRLHFLAGVPLLVGVQLLAHLYSGMQWY
jgi:hypothetical protein